MKKIYILFFSALCIGVTACSEDDDSVDFNDEFAWIEDSSVVYEDLVITKSDTKNLSSVSNGGDYCGYTYDNNRLIQVTFYQDPSYSYVMDLTHNPIHIIAEEGKQYLPKASYNAYIGENGYISSIKGKSIEVHKDDYYLVQEEYTFQYDADGYLRSMHCEYGDSILQSGETYRFSKEVSYIYENGGYSQIRDLWYNQSDGGEDQTNIFTYDLTIQNRQGQNIYYNSIWLGHFAYPLSYIGLMGKATEMLPSSYTQTIVEKNNTWENKISYSFNADNTIAKCGWCKYSYDK